MENTFWYDKSDNGKLIIGLALAELILLLLWALAFGTIIFAGDRSNRQPIAQRVDVIELNHVVHDFGPGYSQVILWVWSPDYRRHDCIGWFIVNPNKLADLPQATHDGFWVAKQGTNYFRSKVFRETITSVDPERENGKLRGKSTPPIR